MPMLVKKTETEVLTAVAVTQSPNNEISTAAKVKINCLRAILLEQCRQKTEGAGGMKLILGEMKFIPGRMT